MLRKKSINKIFFLHICARQGTRTHHNLTYTQNVDNKGSVKFNEIKLNVSFFIIGKIGPKKVFPFHLRVTHTDTLKLSLC